MGGAGTGLSIETGVTLNDGNRIPILGFGVFQIDDGAECERAVMDALEAGYRHVDTAFVYGNEASVGSAIARSEIARADLFVTTKTPFDLSPESIRSVFEGSLERLKVEYVDLYLIHWPMADALLCPAWETLEQLRDEGKCRSIGVSNFTVRRLEDAFLGKVSTVPAVNQFEMHVFNQQQGLVGYCRGKGIQAEAYSPLSRAQRLSDPAIRQISAAHGKSPAQVMIRWLLQQGTVAIPKSATTSRIRENADVFDFELSDTQMRLLDGLNDDLSVQSWRPKGFY